MEWSAIVMVTDDNWMLFLYKRMANGKSSKSAFEDQPLGVHNEAVK